jgi:hypothetical protein
MESSRLPLQHLPFKIIGCYDNMKIDVTYKMRTCKFAWEWYDIVIKFSCYFSWSVKLPDSLSAHAKISICHDGFRIQNLAITTTFTILCATHLQIVLIGPDIPKQIKNGQKFNKNKFLNILNSDLCSRDANVGDRYVLSTQRGLLKNTLKPNEVIKSLPFFGNPQWLLSFSFILTVQDATKNTLGSLMNNYWATKLIFYWTIVRIQHSALTCQYEVLPF